jgi:hypothetical protein
MYYSDRCSYCSRVFYTFSDRKEQAAATLYAGIKQHLQDYGEDEKEHKFDDGASLDTNEIYAELTESNEPPAGGYELK